VRLLRARGLAEINHLFFIRFEQPHPVKIQFSRPPEAWKRVGLYEQRTALSALPRRKASGKRRVTHEWGAYAKRPQLFVPTRGKLQKPKNPFLDAHTKTVRRS
jgi:hypothetical protein